MSLDEAGTRAPTDPALERARIPLLELIQRQSLDEDYADAARRRAEAPAALSAPSAGSGRPPSRRIGPVALALVVFGGLLSVAFVQTRDNADVDSASRSSLIRQVEARRDRLERQQNRLARLRTRVDELTTQVAELTDADQAAALRALRIGSAAGTLAVVGEGVRVLITEPDSADDVSKVHDEDLALLVNGLFEAGAEAITVNGQRLTAVTAIRTSGTAIEVNGVGIGPPYTVLAIGDTGVLGARLFETKSGLDFAATADYYGFDYTLENVDRLVLPAAPPRVTNLRSARINSFGPGNGKEDDEG